MSLGKGTKSAKELRGYVEEIELVNERIKQLGEQRSAVFAAAKAAKFDVKTLRKIIALRRQEAGERTKAQDLLDTYLRALDMAEPPPIFATIGALAVDGATREALIDAFKPVVPAGGEVILKLGGKPVRLFRDADGAAHAEDYVDPPPTPRVPVVPIDDEDDLSALPSASRAKSKSRIDDIVERAERTSKARAAAAKASASSVPDPAS